MYIKYRKKLDIKKITVNYDFNFNVPCDLLFSRIASFTMDKIVNQTWNLISSGELIIFNGNLDIKNDYFLMKGKLYENKKIENKFNIIVYSNNSNLINISCETTNEIFDNF